MIDPSAASSTHPILEQYGVPENAVGAKKELGRDAFMKLLIAQMNNQNPLEPQDNGDFISQLAEFSSLEGIETLNDTVTNVATSFESNRALQASSLVGQSVVVPSLENSFLEYGGIASAYAELPSSTSNLVIQIENENGTSIKEQVNLGMHASGPVNVRWDGWNLEVDGKIIELENADRNRKPLEQEVEDENGEVKTVEVMNPYPPGKYKIRVVAKIDGQTEDLGAMMSSKVDSVTLGKNNQVTLNLTGGTKASLNDVKMIME